MADITSVPVPIASIPAKNGAPVPQADVVTPLTVDPVASANAGQLDLFNAPPTFDERFLADHAGQIMSDPRIAIVELLANAYDAGATKVKITWPLQDGDSFEVADNGTGLTADEFARRWRKFSYNRREEQGDGVEFPTGARGVAKRKAFGQSGKGRHGAFCFDDSYVVDTKKAGRQFSVRVDLLKASNTPFDFHPIKSIDCGPKEHGTTIAGKIVRNRIEVTDLQEAIGSKFLVDPSFHVFINGSEIALVDIKHLTKQITVTSSTGKTVEVYRIDAPDDDRTTRLRGITWWVNGKMVGLPSWEGVDSQGAILDGRRRAAKRHSFVIKADCLAGHQKPDWEGFYDDREVQEVKRAIREHVTKEINAILADSRKERKLQALQEQRETLKQLPQVSLQAVGHFIDEVQQKCTSLTDTDLSKAVEVFTKMERARTGYELLAKLADCTIADIDAWNELMQEWTVDRASLVLAEMKRRLDLITELQKKVHDKNADELHELQPLFAEGLWIFGPEYDSPDFIGNRQMATVVGSLLKLVPDKDLSERRPDFVVLPDRSISVYAADAYGDSEVTGFRKILILELKKGAFTLTHDEMVQGQRYAIELQNKVGKLATTKFQVFVMGSEIGDARHAPYGENISVDPLCFDAVLRRAHARTFNLQMKLAKLQPRQPRDVEVDAVLSTAEQPLFDEERTSM